MQKGSTFDKGVRPSLVEFILKGVRIVLCFSTAIGKKQTLSQRCRKTVQYFL
jgi:hypothetical protein